MSANEQLRFLPFHAINEFMRNDFRGNIIRTTFTNLDSLENKYGAAVDRLVRKHVKVPGFRNSAKAPATMKAVAAVKAFEKEPQLVAAIINAWSEIKKDLKQQIYGILLDRGWQLLPIEIDRTRLPGFFTEWPEEDDYEVLYDAYRAAYPEEGAGIDETSLMVIWLAGRLPVDKVSKSDISMPDVFQDSLTQPPKES